MTLPRGFEKHNALSLVEKGKSFYSLHKYEEAEDCFDKALKIDPSNVDAWLGKGISLVRLGKYDEAIACYDRIIKDLDPRHIRAWLFKGAVLVRSRKYDEAIACYDRIIKDLDRSNVDAWINMGFSTYLSSVNNRDEAIKYFDKATELKPDDAVAWTNKITLLQRSGRINEAIKSVNEALKNTNEPFTFYRIKGNIYGNKGELDTALESYKRALQKKQDYIPAFLDKGEVHEFKGQYNYALESYKEAERIANDILQRTKTEEEDHVSTLIYKGNLLIKLGRYEEAIDECYQKVISDLNKDPYYVSRALYGKGRAHYNLGEYYEAIDKDFKEALGIAPTDTEIIVHQGLCLDRIGEYRKAIESYDIGLNIASGNVELLINKGSSLINIGEYRRAIDECFDKALVINPNHVRALISKGISLAYIGEYRRAIDECFDKALVINPNYADALMDRGEALYDLKRDKEAIQCFEQAKDCYDLILNLNPQSVEALANKGVAHYRLQEYEKAIRYYKDAINVNKNFTQAWFNEGLALYSLKKHYEAIKCFGVCTDINRNSSEAFIAIGWIYNDWKEYEKAIESYDEALNIKTITEDTKSLAYFSKGESKYALGKYESALKNFKNIAQNKYNGQKQVNIGLCNYQLGFYDEAEKQYLEAINFDSELTYAYYNLAVLYNNEDKRDKAKKMLQSCLNIDRNFSQARESIKRLEYSEQSDWYNWWFGGNRVKKLFGIGIILSIIALIVIISYVSLGFANVSMPTIVNVTKGEVINGIVQNVTSGSQLTAVTGNVSALAALAAILFGMLLLPSLKTFKVAGVEMESEFSAHKNVELEPAIALLETKNVTWSSSRVDTAFGS